MLRHKLLAVIWLALFVALAPPGWHPAWGATYGPNPDVNYDIPNFTYSPPLRKFVDSLPGLGATATNNLGQYIPVATPDTTTYPGSDYYEIALVEYREQMHSDLPPVVIPPGSTLGKADPQATGGTKLRGYVQEHNGVMDPAGPHYMGPMIIATKDRPVRIKFTNRLPAGAAGDLFLPVDTQVMGAGDYTKGDLADPTSLVSGTFTQNRAVVHLHGGLPGWTSDGTPHQWISPAGEFQPGAAGANYPKGVGAENVPDMPVPPDGSITLYWPNQMSGRLMFYHDHAYGITGPNVYAGEAAGYLVVDPAERALTDGSTTGVPAMTEIPLVIQDKTFVPDATTLAATDPLWDSTKWGGFGSLWMPHVYMPNQDPYNPGGATPYGRWDYGPWFWPVFPASGPMPTISHIPESFMDTPVVNGTAYPYLDVQPTTYRLRILNAANDRMFNLQLYQADPNVSVGAAGLTEVKMVPAVADPALPFPTLWQTQVSGMIPEILDGRPGGVPDPNFIGPAMIQIGNEGGLLPAPVLLPNTPVGYEQNKRNIVIGNVSQKNLFLAPAERADVIVDFSQYAGKTIILYNDAPAPVPAGDPRNDFYTGNPDQTSMGGHATTLPGYGPNTRTILQFRVAAAQAAPQFAPSTPPPTGPEATPPAALVTALATAFNATQDAPIVSGVTSRIQDTEIPLTPQPLASISVTNPGSGYTSAPTVIFAGGTPGSGAAATANVSNGKVTSITLTNPGTGYSYPPTILLSGGGGSGATASATVANAVQMQPKTIQELFDPLGRMNATLGVELPFTNAFIQTTIPLGYIDPSTETLAPNEVQLWKITHNGVDTHGIHFHLVNVQVVNRVGWDGAIRLPDPNEMGWKDTVRMNPLEDTIIAVKAKPPVLPFGQPDSIRPLDVTQPIGSTMNFSNIDPLTGNPPANPVTNILTNFGWEYIWHCHLLGHEENDMMRTIMFKAPSALPPAFAQKAALGGTTVTLGWVDPTPYDYASGLPDTVWPAPGSTLNNPGNEIGFKIMRADASGPFTQIGIAPANSTTFVDQSPLAGTNRYQIVAYNAAGSTASNTVTVTATPPVYVTTASLAAASVGAPYNQTLAASGGTTPYGWSVSAGLLPAGLTLNSGTGAISGTPSAPGVSTFTVTVTDANNITATKALSLNVAVAAALTTVSLPSATIGVSYNAQLGATGGVAPYTWSISTGTLPAGLTLNSATGVISGTPTSAATANFMVTATGTDGSKATGPLTLVVAAPVSITTAALSAGMIGTAYSQTLAASGGVTPYTWSLSTGALPAGLALDPASGVISGTPTAAGTYTFTVAVSDPGGRSATKQLSIAVTSLSVTTTTLAVATQGAGYTSTVTVTGGTAPYTWSLSSGSLPSGVTLNSSGVLSGTPTSSGTYNFTVSVSDATNASASQALSLTVNLPVSIATTSLTGGSRGVPYSQTLVASNGTAPFTWSLSSGTMPAGLTLSSAGVISGTPTTLSYYFTVKVTDANGSSATKTFFIPITAPLTITTTTLPAGATGLPYRAALAATGGTTIRTWSITAGSLPTGLTLGAGTGGVGGTPSSAGTFNFTVTVTDSAGRTASQNLAITVSVPVTITNVSLAPGTTGIAYNETLTATGAVAPYTWSLTSGALPRGMTLNSGTGVISGTPTLAGSYSFSVRATAANGNSATKAFKISVTAPVSISTTTLVSVATGSAYRQTLYASGGTGPYTWSITAGALPAGLTLATTGTISGTPTAAGTFNFTVQATDSAGRTATKALSITIWLPLTVATTSLPNGTVGVSYSQTLTASGLTPPYSWSRISGSLPSGLLLYSSGVISGTPTRTGTYTFTVRVVKGTSSATKTLSITIQ